MSTPLNCAMRFLAMVLLFCTGTLFAVETLEFKNHSYPPGQTTLTALESGTLINGIRVRLTKKGIPVAGERVGFHMVNAPGKGTKIALGEVTTNPEGIAVTTLTLGEKPGDYLIEARLLSYPKVEPLVIKIKALRSGWVFFLILGLLGGLALFLFGMDTSSEGLQKAAGDKMRTILGKLTNKPIMGVLVGVLTTAAVQSSSATTVMVIGFVNSALMTLKQAIGVIFGCNIGTTLTVQLIAFNIADYATLLIALGFFLDILFGRKAPVIKHAGQIIFGFGLIFFGMGLMSESMNPLRSVPAFTNLLANIGENPIIGLLIATLFTGIIQSSGAVIGISIAMAAQGILTLKAAIIISFGANVGTTVTAMLGSLNSGPDGKRVSLIHLFFNVAGVMLFFPFINLFTEFIQSMTNKIEPGNISRSIANAHMIFNIANTVIFLPFVGVFEKIVKKLIPEKEPETLIFGPKYLEGNITSTGIALEQARREIDRMGQISQNIINLQPEIWTTSDTEAYARMVRKEGEKVNILANAVKKYLREVAKLTLTAEEAHEASYYLRLVEIMRHLVLNTDTEVLPALQRALSYYAHFSEQEKGDIHFIQTKLSELLKRNHLAFMEKNLNLAEESGLLHKKLKFLLKKLQNQNMVSLLQKSDGNPEGISAYNDLLETFRELESDISQFNKTVIENAT